MKSPRTPSPNPKKLLGSKWTAAQPSDREKHFVVTKVYESRTPGDASVRMVELQAVISNRRRVMPSRDLEDADAWRRGWL